MDPLSALLDTDEDRTSEVWVDGPWTLPLEARPWLSILTVLSEEVWIGRSDRAPVRVRAGEIAVLGADSPHVLAHTAVPDGAAVRIEAGRARIGGAGPGGSHLLLRRYPLQGSMIGTLVAGLPVDAPLSSVRDSPFWPLLRDESRYLSPARGSVISHLLDLLFVDVVRRWIDHSVGHGWLRAGLDPIVGEALRLLHENPAHPWTLAELATQVGASRATLSSRFHLLVGEPPMRYLQQCRLDRAARMLREGTASVSVIAMETGFTDPFVFSAAFSRRFGVPPGRYRDTATRSVELA